MADQADIYAAVIQRLYGVENGVIVSNFPVLYIAQPTSGQFGDSGTEPAPEVLSAELQRAIIDRLKVLPAQIIWVTAYQDIPWDMEGTRVKDGGAGVTLGTIEPQKDGKVHVAGGMYYGNVGAHGSIYVLEKQDGTWKVIGTSGPQWIS